MPTGATIEQRLEAVEAALAALQRKLAAPSPSPNWLEQVTGSFKDEPAFVEVLEHGRAIRAADRPPDGDAGA